MKKQSVDAFIPPDRKSSMKDGKYTYTVLCSMGAGCEWYKRRERVSKKEAERLKVVYLKAWNRVKIKKVKTAFL